MSAGVRLEAFEVWFRRIGEAHYGAQLVRASSNVGTVVDFKVPFDDDELALIRQRAEGRLSESPADGMKAMEQVGEILFEILFQGEMLTALRCCRAALGRGRKLRLTLDFTQAPKLAELPWEYLFDPQEREFMLPGGAATLVRRLGSRAGELTPTPEGPVRMAVVVPVGEEDLGGDNEWNQLQELLAPEVRAGRLKLLRIDADSMTTLQQQLKGESYHILHLIRHGGPDSLFFKADEHSSGRDVVLSRRFATLLKDQPDLRLVVLNSCEGARAEFETSLPAMAAELERRGIPNVVAMQFDIRSDLAVSFAVRFYAALSQGHTVDEALAECWRDLYSGSNRPAWGTPVLYAARSGQRLFSQTAWWNKRRIINAAAALVILVVLGWLTIGSGPQKGELRVFVEAFDDSQGLAGPQHEVVVAKLQAAARNWPRQAGPPLRIVHSGCRPDGRGSWEEGGSSFVQLRQLASNGDVSSSHFGVVDGKCRTQELVGLKQLLDSTRSSPKDETLPADPFPLESRIAEWLLEKAGVSLSPVLKESIRTAVASDVGEWTLQGVKHLQKRDYSAARRCFQNAIDSDERFAPAHSYLALAESGLGRIASAVEHAREAVQIDPGDGHLRFNYGILLAHPQQDQIEDAIVQLRVAAEDYAFPDAWNELGRIYLDRGDWKKARRVLVNGLAAKPGDPRMRKNLARAKLKLGELESALADLKGIESTIGDRFFLLLEITYLKALLHHELGERDEACLRLKLLRQTDGGAESVWFYEGKKLEETINCAAGSSET